MKTNTHTPQQALNKAFLKVKTNKTDLDAFAQALQTLLQHTNDKESEEYHKNLIADFLKHIYKKEKHFINTKGRNDLVIHNDKTAASDVGIIIETKKPSNKSEMPQPSKLNSKALQELVLYYLRERITHKNLAIKHLIITNVHEWFIFDASVFERAFANNKKLVQDFENFEAKMLVDSKTDFFYQQIASPMIEQLEKTDLQEFTHFSLKDYNDATAYDAAPAMRKKWIALYKFFSPYHLLKLPFANDSNSLDRAFYTELLHIIGLTEEKDGGKKLIRRKPINEREQGSLLENAIAQIENNDKLDRLDQPKQFGDTPQDRLFNVGLELVITWVNRILFLKLLEAQLLNYNKKDQAFTFLQLEKVRNFNDLNQLFFSVLARRLDERPSRVRPLFDHVPYLNSSLFEQTDLEDKTLFINSLDSEATLRLHPSTVLKDHNGKKRMGALPALEYLFEFLNAYDFSSEGVGDVQEDNKTLINASVLGLIFEKINGYKDGSFFTPGFITMYMCRETIRKAVLQKFEDVKGWKCATIDELEDRIEDRQEANQLINSLKICDPAVGSGHFLVSALNELIAIKSELGILLDRKGKRLKNYTLEVANDELTITDEDGELFAYRPKNPESQRVQEALFHEKQTLIENCLFGVDINPNSVKICRLRLWVELLKNAYYKNDSELETLPNIDINIKCGNSLISRFELDDNLKTAFKSKENPYSLQDYKDKVNEYKKTNNKQDKKEILTIIQTIKSAFKDTLNKKFLSKLAHARGEYERQQQHLQNLEVFGQAVSKKEKDELKRVYLNFEKAKAEKEEILNNAIYENAFEWRFEFPEVLNDEGDFIGFDAIIGNPPYIQLQSMKDISEQYKRFGYLTYEKTGDIYSLFYEKGNQILKNNGYLAYITSNKWLRAGYGKTTRNYFLQHTQPHLLIDLGSGIFEEATVDSNILLFSKCTYTRAFAALDVSKEKKLQNLSACQNEFLTINPIIDENWTIASDIEQGIKNKIEANGIPLKNWDIHIYRGILTGFNDAFIIDTNKKDELIKQDPKSAEIIKPILRGRDIKRYKAEFANLWLINSHNGVKGTFPKIDVPNDYPAIYQHLLQNAQGLAERQDKGDHWTNLRNCAYIQEFEKEKIIFQEMVQSSSFLFDNKENYFCLDTGRIIVGGNLKFLISIFNSKLFFHAVKFYYGGGGLGNSGVRMKHTFFENIPIPQLSELEQQPFISLVEQILAKKAKNEDTSALETEIDTLVYALYGLTEEEIAIVERGQ